MSKWNSLPSSSSGRRSRRSILNDSPFYDVLQFNNGHQQQQPCPNPHLRNNTTGHHQPTQSRTSSSLGYGSYQRERPISMYSSSPSQHHHHHAGPPPTGQSFDNFAKEQMMRRSSLPRIDSPSPSVSAIYASISGGGGGQTLGKNNAAKIMPPRSRSAPRIASSIISSLPPPIPRPAVTVRPHPHNKYPPWRPRSAYELLAYQNLQNSAKKFNPSSRKLIHGNGNNEPETKLKIASSTDSSSQRHENSGAAEMSATSSTTIKSRTELQLQFPMGRMVFNNKMGGGRRGGYKIGAKNDPGTTTTPGRIVTTVQFDTNQDGVTTTTTTASSGKNGGGDDPTTVDVGEDKIVTNCINNDTTTMHDKLHHLSSSPSPNTSSTDEGVDIAN